MINVCKGMNCGTQGFLTKPLTYLKYIKSLPNYGNDNNMSHIILMDSDTFWADSSISSIWSKYDCARHNKPILLSTEMSCWVGRYCTKDDLNKWYKDPYSIPSYSPFANSGIIMGTLSSVAKMLEYVIVNNQSYYTTYFKRKFDDQYAIADYAINIAPSEVALDYHQQISASFSMHATGPDGEDGWPFVCKSTRGNFSMSCPNYSPKVVRQGHFYTNQSTCNVERQTYKDMFMKTELDSLHKNPVIWHGNGAGKQYSHRFGHETWLCWLKKRNMTQDDWVNSYG
jgi:hypothetical protein